ncbi:hypothetical protein Tco_1082655 [Tanacetum coccineum]|uniref:Uncharacterized protein n=1 Tax=Tanacetum coccineum TaxID=301880 RepID=A0ABQ5I2I6_9ASTR
MSMTIQSSVKDKILATSSETSKVENAPAEMLRDLDQQMEKRADDGKANVVTDALSRKERVKPRRVRAMAMTIQYGVRGMIEYEECSISRSEMDEAHAIKFGAGYAACVPFCGQDIVVSSKNILVNVVGIKVEFGYQSLSCDVSNGFGFVFVFCGVHFVHFDGQNDLMKLQLALKKLVSEKGALEILDVTKLSFTDALMFLIIPLAGGVTLLCAVVLHIVEDLVKRCDLRNFWSCLVMRISSLKCVDKAPYYPGFYGDHHDNPLLAKKTKSKLIIWDIWDEEEEYTFIDNYSNFQEEENDVSFLGVEEKLMPVYDTDIECIVEEMVTCGDGVVIYVDHVESLMIQYLSIDDFEEDINTKSHELMWFKKTLLSRLEEVR